MSDDVATRLIESMNATYGVHPGHRSAHAKGVLCAAMFTAAPEASTLSRASRSARNASRSINSAAWALARSEGRSSGFKLMKPVNQIFR